MPRDSNGNASLVPGYLAVTGQKVLASQHNPPLEDLASMMTGTLPRNGSAGMLADMTMGGFRITGLGNGVSDDDAVNRGQLNSFVPTGVILPYGGQFQPDGWFFCLGQELNRTTYAALFAVIGVTFGAGDGSLTFNVPDMRGRVIAGRDENAGGRLAAFYGAVAMLIGGALGVASHVLTLSQSPSHDHGGTVTAAGSHAHTVLALQATAGPTIAGTAGAGVNAATISTSTAPDHSHAIAAQGGDQAHPNAQPTLIANYIIKAF